MFQYTPHEDTRTSRILAIFCAVQSTHPEVETKCNVEVYTGAAVLKLTFTPFQYGKAFVLVFDPVELTWLVERFDHTVTNYMHAIVRLDHIFEVLGATAIFNNREGNKGFMKVMEELLSRTCPGKLEQPDAPPKKTNLNVSM